MKLFKKNDVVLAAIDGEIQTLHEKLESIDPASSEYTTCARNLELIMKLRDEKLKGSKIPPEVWVPVVANLAGICLILFWEQTHVITSKALMLLKKR